MVNQQKMLNMGGSLLNLGKPAVMGIMNITPDSFFAGSRVSRVAEAIACANKMFEEGASIVDVGAASTRPGAVMIEPQEEITRLKEIIPLLRKEFPGKFFSIDTYHSETASFALNEGFNMINDVSAGQFSPTLPMLAARFRVPYVLMHMKGTPADMQAKPEYEDVFSEVFSTLVNKAAELRKQGLHDIVLDPGFGFGKSPAHNYALMRELSHFKISGMPLMVGISRKSMISRLLQINAAEALNGSTVLHTWALLHGADLLRVHDVKEAVECIKICSELRKDVA